MEPDDTELTQDVVGFRSTNSTPPAQMNHIHQASDAQPDIFERHRHLIQWVLKHSGSIHEHVRLAHSSRKGYHAVVASDQTVPQGSRIVACTMELTLSVLNALDIEPFSSRGTRFPASFLSAQASQPQSLQAFFLMDQLVKGEHSWWAPYISTLPTPQDISNLQFDCLDDLVWLEGTNLKAALATQTDNWREMFDTGLQQLRDQKWPNALNGSYTWERFQWAATIFGSRSFTSQVLDDTLPADKARHAHLHPRDKDYDLVELFSGHFGVLLPLLDIFNHRPGAKVEWQARYSFVGLQVLETYNAAQELSNNYGPKDNESLLLAYGFTIPSNPFDHVVISLKSRPGSMLAESRRWKKDPRSDPEYRCFIFDHRHPSVIAAVALEVSLFSYDLLDGLSVQCANERETTLMSTARQTVFSQCLLERPERPCFEDGRLILATLCQLFMDCTARAARLRATDPRAGDPLIKPTTAKQQDAKVYRDSQLAIVETAAALCGYVLRTATHDSTPAEPSTEAQPLLPEYVQRNLATLLKLHPRRLTRPFELLTPFDILEMLPVDVAGPLRRLLNGIEENIDIEGQDGLTKTMALQKAQLAVLTSALYSEFDRGIKLPHRLSTWLKTLSERYPLDSEWSFVPEPGPWSPGEEPPSTLMKLLGARASLSPQLPTESHIKQWLIPDRICWGYNVMEEMIVLVPSTISGGEANPNKDLVTIHMFWMDY
ncbi:hypothetical protein PV10_01883 [Exophiala mesophila]|uniref:SET domain-containing protein n=1 Tax=Exophiala mesophila TaxID=212818 RepID=A0A0D1ZUJ9_EXOME|nr:uncharacterized protein PV10_01883 [Exophiala mesophila]KIV98207.1 hypothetical protein PV10_01883 [Exophiala mesophila]